MAEKDHGLSKAHSFSKFAIIDPVYDAESVAPDGGWMADRAPWIYGPTELEAWRHHVLRVRSEQTAMSLPR